MNNFERFKGKIRDNEIVDRAVVGAMIILTGVPLYTCEPFWRDIKVRSEIFIQKQKEKTNNKNRVNLD